MRDKFFVCVDVRIEGYGYEAHDQDNRQQIHASAYAQTRTKRGDIQRRVQDVEK